MNLPEKSLDSTTPVVHNVPMSKEYSQMSSYEKWLEYGDLTEAYPDDYDKDDE